MAKHISITNRLQQWLRVWSTPKRPMPRQRARLAVEALEARELLTATPLPAVVAPPPPAGAELKPVLMVLANRDFFYGDYNEPRRALLEAGYEVEVAAATTAVCVPHSGSGQGADGGFVTPDLAIADVDASQYSAVVFVGGWGASQYQYAIEGTYTNSIYRGSAAVRGDVNELINDFVDQDKYVTALCTGVSILAWARVDGASLLDGRTVAGYAGTMPAWVGANGVFHGDTTTRWHVEANGATMFASGAIGNKWSYADDIWVDGRVITAEDYRSCYLLGQVLAEHLTAELPTVEPVAPTPPAEPEAPTPPADPVDETPPAEPVDETPPAEPVDEAPPTDPIDETPPVDEAPPVDPVNETPPNEPVDETPPVNEPPVSEPPVSEQPTDPVPTPVEEAPAAEPRRVLMVIANQDFFYQEYAEPRGELEAAGFVVEVAAATRTLSRPHLNSGQGAANGFVMPDWALADVDSTRFEAIVFVGGWGASQYQYAYTGVYDNPVYNGSDQLEATVNDLINEFVAADKYIAGICHGVSVLAWARVDGESLLDGVTVAGFARGAPANTYNGTHYNYYEQTNVWHIEANGGTVFAHGAVGNPYIDEDDVWVDGKIITAENNESARVFGQVLVQELNR